MADEGRQRRRAARVRQAVVDTLENRVKDHRVGFMTITDVKVTGDLQHATIYYTVLGDEDEVRSTRRALESAKGLIRSQVGRALGARLTPTISFELDAVPEVAASLEEALQAAKERDAELAKQREGKKYAAGESPYKEERPQENE